jgi:hypothetical protein
MYHSEKLQGNLHLKLFTAFHVTFLPELSKWLAGWLPG